MAVTVRRNDGALRGVLRATTARVHECEGVVTIDRIRLHCLHERFDRA
jgi:hypothetical protein